MTEVVSIRFKSSGKNYYFSPNGLQLSDGDIVIVETAKGLEMAECARGNRMVEDATVIQPLRPVLRKATPQDLRIAEQNKLREKDALAICQKKIEEHGLEMKLVDVECSFDGSKTLFFFTADGRVDFRELVKDLASIFHNRIELRQIGVRDEAKMLGGIGICGRPYCCNSFLNDFAPVSTKMAKIQNLSLNPAKISGSCGRLMCCLRYEEEAYEDLVKHVPKIGAFVETTEGYGTVSSVELLRQRVKVHLEGESEDSTHLFKASEVAAVPGGQPKEGEPYPHVLEIVPEEEPEEDFPEDPWAVPTLFVDKAEEASPIEEEVAAPEPPRRSSRRRRSRNSEHSGDRSNERSSEHSVQPKQTNAAPQVAETSPSEGGKPSSSRSRRKPAGQRHGPKPAAPQKDASPSSPAKKTKQPRDGENGRAPSSAPAQATAEGPRKGSAQKDGAPAKKPGHRRKFYSRGKKSSGTGSTSAP